MASAFTGQSLRQKGLNMISRSPPPPYGAYEEYFLAQSSRSSVDPHPRKEKTMNINKSLLWTAITAFGGLSFLVSVPVHQAHAQDTTPVVFQAAGPTAASIQGTVDAFRAALGDPNNANNPGPLTSGRREINWDGGGSDTTTDPVTPFNVFL